MILNDNIINNRTILTDTVKRGLIAAFAHLEPEDQNYILDHLESFACPGTVFVLPTIKNEFPSILTKFANYININKAGTYRIYTFDASVQHPAVPVNSIIIGNDIACIYRMFQNDPVNMYEIYKLAGRVTFNHPKDLFDTIYYISNRMDACGSSIYEYTKWLLVISKIYDGIMALSSATIGLEDIHVMQTQASAFNYMVKSAKNHLNMKTISELASLEINIITSLIPVRELVEYKYTFRTLIMVIREGNEDLRVQTVKFIHERLDSMLSDPFRISTGERFPKIKGVASISQHYYANPIEKDIKILIENTTREKIKNLIEDCTGVVEELVNITFDIPEKLLTMYQYEFAKDHPIILVPVTKNMNIDHDGSDWRHVIYYGSMPFIAFSLKDSPEKMYGIHIENNGVEDDQCDIVEFTGKDGANYTFLY